MREKVFDASYISAFCMEMYLIIRAGIPFAEGVALLHDDEPDAQRRTILNQLHQQLELGEPFAASMRAAGGFPVYVVEMVEIGQRTGHLERVFHALAGYYERMDTLQKGIRNALTYPAVLMSMMLVVVFVLLVKVLPIFEEVFHQLGAEVADGSRPVSWQIRAGISGGTCDWSGGRCCITSQRRTKSSIYRMAVTKKRKLGNQPPDCIFPPCRCAGADIIQRDGY